jgi:hypothetical protein
VKGPADLWPLRPPLVDWRNISEDDFRAGLGYAGLKQDDLEGKFGLTPKALADLQRTAVETGNPPPTPQFTPEMFAKDAVSRGLAVDRVERFKVENGTVPRALHEHAAQQKQLFITDPKKLAALRNNDTDARAEYENINYILAHKPR